MKINFQDYSVEFNDDNGGFPTRLTQYLRNGRIGEVVHTEEPWLKISLADGRTALPRVDDASLPQLRTDTDVTTHIQYNNIGFYAGSERLNNWRLNLDYEIIPDGNCFIGMSFEAFDFDKPAIDSFILRIPMDFGAEDDVTYGYWPRPRSVDPTGISVVGGFVRNLTDKEQHEYDWIIPSIAFDFGRKGKPSRHIEWFIDDQIALDGSPDHVRTRLLWENGSPVMEYDFETVRLENRPYPYYWRNKFGFTIGQTPKYRDKAPLRVYHYFDQFEHLPTTEQVQKMAAEGADLLNLHECWRSDARNGGFPHDRKRFMELIAECHAHDIRVAPYIRGDEESAKSDSCDWLNYYLKKDYDGLYSDYASPLGFMEVNDEYRGGHIAFKRYYKHFKKLREDTIGRDGILTVHTGPFFSSEIMTSLVDGYVAGEGEHGIMLHTRRENAFFSETTVGPGALWTGAFPAYRTKRMLPFLANIGQYPFVHLGEQWKSCALALSKETGNATFARPLWRLYGLMKNERNIRFDNDICDETIRCDSEETGLSVFGMQDGSKLCLLSNFSDYRRVCAADANIARNKNQHCLRMNADASGCSIMPVESVDHFEVELEAYGICGFLICDESEKWEKRIELFLKPYPEKDAADLAYEEKVAKAAQNRFSAKPAHTAYLKAEMPFYAGTLEMPFWSDFSSACNALYATDTDGERRLLGFIGKNGLTEEEPPVEDRICTGQESLWIPLHDLLKKGKYRIEMQGYNHGSACSMHYRAKLAESPNDAEYRDITYFGELDDNRNRLTFDIELI